MILFSDKQDGREHFWTVSWEWYDENGDGHCEHIDAKSVSGQGAVWSVQNRGWFIPENCEVQARIND